MKRFLAIILIVLISSVSFLSGCDLITRNDHEYFSTTVLKIGDTEINKYLLIERYNQWGSDLVSQGYSYEEAFDQVIENMIVRELLIMEGKEQYGELEQAEINDILEDVYESVNDMLEDYEGIVRSEMDVEITTEEEEEEETFAVYEPYEPEVTYDGATFSKPDRPTFEAEDPIGEFTVRNNNDYGIEESVWQEIQDEAWARYIRNRRNNQAWQELADDDTSVFNNELDRLYDIFEGNYYLEKLEEEFNYNQTIDNEAIEAKYIELVQDSFSKYAINMDQYHSDMASNAESVYWHPSDEYVEVSHILVKYTDEQEELLADIESRHDDGLLGEVEYQQELDALYAQIGAKERVDGVETGEVKLASTILSELNAALAPYSDPAERAEVFNDFIYKYNGDPGMENAEYPYVVNIDTEVDDRMVEAFANESRRLYTEETVGAVSELILTDFGYHIIYYAGVKQNVITYDNLLNITAEELYEQKLNPGSNKTLYHKIYESINSRSYTDYQTTVIEQLKTEIEITIYENRYKELLG